MIPSMLAAIRKNTEFEGEVYGVPHVRGTSGLIVNRKTAALVKTTPICVTIRLAALYLTV